MTNLNLSQRIRRRSTANLISFLVHIKLILAQTKTFHDPVDDVYYQEKPLKVFNNPLAGLLPTINRNFYVKSVSSSFNI